MSAATGGDRTVSLKVTMKEGTVVPCDDLHGITLTIHSLGCMRYKLLQDS